MLNSCTMNISPELVRMHVSIHCIMHNWPRIIEVQLTTRLTYSILKQRKYDLTQSPAEPWVPHFVHSGMPWRCPRVFYQITPPTLWVPTPDVPNFTTPSFLPSSSKSTLRVCPIGFLTSNTSCSWKIRRHLRSTDQTLRVTCGTDEKQILTQEICSTRTCVSKECHRQFWDMRCKNHT